MRHADTHDNRTTLSRIGSFCLAALKAQPYTTARKPFLLNEKDHDILDIAFNREDDAKRALEKREGQPLDAETTAAVSAIRTAMAKRDHAKKLYTDYAGGVLGGRLVFLKAEQNAARALKHTFTDYAWRMAGVIEKHLPQVQAAQPKKPSVSGTN